MAVNISGWGIVGSTLQPACLLQKKGMKCFGLSYEHAYDNGD